MKIILLMMLFGGIFVFEAPGLIYRKYWKELLVFVVFLGFAFVISLMPLLDVQIPSPAKGIEIVVTFFSDMVKKLLQ